jgi:RimJ/RimL family protein N-acetyltransferase
MKLDIPQQFKPLTLTKDKVTLIWEKFKQFPVTDDAGKDDFVWFMQRLASPTSIWFEYHDPTWVGLTWFENIVVGQGADAHVFLWDKRLRGRESIVQEIGTWMFQTFKLERISTYAPSFARATIKFIERVGFKQEGVIRLGYKHNGQLYDYVCFGILKNELAFSGKRSEQSEVKDGWNKNIERTGALPKGDRENVGGPTPTAIPDKLADVPRSDDSRPSPWDTRAMEFVHFLHESADEPGAESGSVTDN